MSEAALHPQEDVRLRALHALQILDTAEEAVYNDVVKMAAEVCGVPIALVSLIDRDRQWFKAKHGLDAAETPRCDAFCAHAILNPNVPLVVNDATKDDRFSNNPLVTGNPDIRFYAGAPLSLDDQMPLGTLCVISDKQMNLSSEQLSMLGMLARHVEGLLNLRKASMQMRITHRTLQRTQAALDSSADGVMWLSPIGQVLYANEQMCKQLGYTENEFMSMSVVDIDPDLESIESYKTKIWPELAQNKRKTFEMRHQHKNGSVFPVEIACRMIEFDDEIFVCAFVRDITDRKAIDAKLTAYAGDLERANSELEQFAMIASHDLKQPLRGISHLAQWAIEDGGDLMPDPSKEHLEKLQSRVVRLSQLLDDLLEYSRVGSRNGINEALQTRDLVEQVIDLIDVPKDFEFCLEGEFPMLMTQRAPLSLVFRNLIGNALKYRRNDAGKVTIVAEKTIDGQHQFIVTDNGIGIAPEFHQYVFGMFHKLNPAEELESSGMGLAMIKKLLDARGGTISLESTGGNGASFTFTWPV